ncbi:MAG: MBL fold metallo-hydrolase [Saccharofermentans sp.]|nr:MBL fold metallo-hydrolase [Saccharofermentans sp.]
MIITYLGHACFKLTHGSFDMIIDPFTAGSVPGLKPLKETVNQVICSHKHGDHFGFKEVKLRQVRTDTPFIVTPIETYHDDKEGALRGPNNVIIIDVDGMKIVHMGDIGCELSDEELEPLMNADILMIPVGGFYTIDGKQAASYVSRISPKITIPMHYRSEGIGYDEIGTVDEFLSSVKDVEVSYIGSELEVVGKPEEHKILVMEGKMAHV